MVGFESTRPGLHKPSFAILNTEPWNNCFVLEPFELRKFRASWEDIVYRRNDLPKVRLIGGACMDHQNQELVCVDHEPKPTKPTPAFALLQDNSYEIFCPLPVPSTTIPKASSFRKIAQLIQEPHSSATAYSKYPHPGPHHRDQIASPSYATSDFTLSVGLLSFDSKNLLRQSPGKRNYMN